MDGEKERFTNGEKKVMASYIPLGLFVERFIKSKESSDECKEFVKKKYVKWCNKYKAVIERYENEQVEKLNKKINKQDEDVEKYKGNLKNLQKYKKQREDLINEVKIYEIDPSANFDNLFNDG